jgi:hypothetical protein
MTQPDFIRHAENAAGERYVTWEYSTLEHTFATIEADIEYKERAATSRAMDPWTAGYAVSFWGNPGTEADDYKEAYFKASDYPSANAAIASAKRWVRDQYANLA